jgi:hypothetical protein
VQVRDIITGEYLNTNKVTHTQEKKVLPSGKSKAIVNLKKKVREGVHSSKPMSVSFPF